MAAVREPGLRVAIVTPSVNRRGGTEKAMSWLVEDLAERCDLTLVTGGARDTRLDLATTVRIPMIKHPRLLRYLTFLLLNTVWFWLRRLSFDRIITSGGDCFFADTVYAHFCCAAWLERLREQRILRGQSARQRLVNLHYMVFLSVAGMVEKVIYGRARYVIAVSDGTSRELQRHYRVPAERIVVIPNAVDPRVRMTEPERITRRLSVRLRHGVPKDAAVLLFLAAGDWKRKGLSLTLEALGELSPELATRLLVVGDGEIDHYAARAEQLGIAERVTFCGRSSAVEDYYAAADIFVYPSHYEAFPLVVLEAAGAGLPLVITKMNGAEDLVRDGRNGYIVEREAGAIAARIRGLLEDPDGLRRMGLRAAEDSRAFTREAVATRVLDLLASGPG